MKKLGVPFAATILISALLVLAFKPDKVNVQNGDIVFQTTGGEFGEAIQLATASDYSHVGIVFIEQGVPMVYEAVQPVQAIPLSYWIKNGQNEHFVTKRLADASTHIDTKVVNDMLTLAKGWLGKNYDSRFHWSDQAFYCSELVWKLYERAAGIKLGELVPLKSFDLTDPVVKKRLQIHYGSAIPWEQEIISPQAMFDSPLLVTVP